MRAPTLASQWNGHSPVAAVSRSMTTGSSQKITSLSVMAKEWIIVVRWTSITSLRMTAPFSSAT